MVIITTIGINIVEIVAVLRSALSSAKIPCLPEIIPFSVSAIRGTGIAYLRPPMNILVLVNGG